MKIYMRFCSRKWLGGESLASRVWCGMTSSPSQTCARLCRRKDHCLQTTLTSLEPSQRPEVKFWWIHDNYYAMRAFPFLFFSVFMKKCVGMLYCCIPPVRKFCFPPVLTLFVMEVFHPMVSDVPDQQGINRRFLVYLTTLFQLHLLYEIEKYVEVVVAHFKTLSRICSQFLLGLFNNILSIWCIIKCLITGLWLNWEVCGRGHDLF
jgi:hypothetical protein